jgi:hypothetical protein
MRVGIDAEPAPEVNRPLVPSPVQIQSPRVGVDFYGNPMLGTGSKDAFNVDIITWPSQQLPSSHMAENCRVWIRHRSQDPLGLRRAILAKLAVNARHNEIKAADDLVRVVERAIRQNVGFDSLEDAEAFIAGVELIDRFVLCDDFFDSQSASVVSGL